MSDDAPPDAEESAYRELARRGKRARIAVALPCLLLGFAAGAVGYQCAYLLARAFLPTFWMAGLVGGAGFILPVTAAAYGARGLGRALVRARAPRWIDEVAASHHVAAQLLRDAVAVWK